MERLGHIQSSWFIRKTRRQTSPRRLIVGLLLLSGHVGYAAPATILTAPVDLQGDGKLGTVQVMADGQVKLSTASGQATQLSLRESPESPPLSPVTQAKAQVETSRESRFLVVRAQLAGGRQQSLVATIQGMTVTPAFVGATGPIGRDAEREVQVAVTSAGLIRYQRSPAIQRCDGESRLFVERFVAGQGPASQWQAAPEITLPTLAASPLLKATRPPAAVPTSSIGIFRATSASAQAGVVRADLLAPPHELEDGKPSTAWRVSHDATGAFVSFAADGIGHQVHALKLVPAPTAAGAMPTQIELLLDAKQRIPVQLSGTGEQWIALPSPLPVSCISLLISAAETRPGQYSALGEVIVYTELDLSTQLAPSALMRELLSPDQTRAEGALRTVRILLTKAEPSRLTGLFTATAQLLPSAQGAGRRRLHEVLLRLAENQLSEPQRLELAALTTLALEQAEPSERPQLFATLEQLGPAGTASALGVLEDMKRPLVLRTEILTHPRLIGGGEVLTTLLRISQQDPKEPALQRGLVSALAQTAHCVPINDPRAQALQAALFATFPQSDSLTTPATFRHAARVVEALGLSRYKCPLGVSDAAPADVVVQGYRRLIAVGSPADTALSEAAFLLRYRALQALARIGVPAEAQTTLLKEVINAGSDAVLRAAAVRVLASFPVEDSTYRELLTHAAADADPGVRIATAGVLAQRKDAAAVQLSERLLQSDRWPPVRRAAVVARTSQCGASSTEPVPAIRAAVSDEDETVRRLALTGLARCEGAGAVEIYASTLKASDAPPALRSQACALLARHGLTSTSNQAAQTLAHQSISAALSDLLTDHSADERHAGTLSSCTKALADLGNSVDLPALLQLADSDLPVPLRSGALDAVAKICKRTNAGALERGLRKDLDATLKAAQTSTEAGIQSAARRALEACPH